MSVGRLFVISAPSGAGKSTVCGLVRERRPGLAYSVSLTTRDPRPGEVNGRDYIFISGEDFMSRVASGEMAEWAMVHGNLYGTSARILQQTLDQGQDLLLDIDVQGARQIKARFPQAVTIFLLPPSREELERRLRSRGTEDEEAILKRLARAGEEMDASDDYDFQVVNDDLERAVNEVLEVMAGAHPPKPGGA